MTENKKIPSTSVNYNYFLMLPRGRWAATTLSSEDFWRSQKLQKGDGPAPWVSPACIKKNGFPSPWFNCHHFPIFQVRLEPISSFPVSRGQGLKDSTARGLEAVGVLLEERRGLNKSSKLSRWKQRKRRQLLSRIQEKWAAVPHTRPWGTGPLPAASLGLAMATAMRVGTERLMCDSCLHPGGLCQLFISQSFYTDFYSFHLGIYGSF